MSFSIKINTGEYNLEEGKEYVSYSKLSTGEIIYTDSYIVYKIKSIHKSASTTATIYICDVYKIESNGLENKLANDYFWSPRKKN